MFKLNNFKKILSQSVNLNSMTIMFFVALSILMLFNHEPYRDEATQWLRARDCQNLSSFVGFFGYGGHMGIWPLILFLLAKLGLPYISMSIVHSLLILLAIVIFLRHAPFSKLQKSLFVFGYYPLYEYNAIARNYVLSVLFLFLIAMLYKKRFIKPVLYSFFILLLANTNVHALFIAVVISSVYILELKSRQKIHVNKRNLISILIIVAGISLAAYQLLPHHDQNPDTARWNLDLTADHISAMPRAIIGAFLPIPRLRIGFWTPKLMGSPLSSLLLLGVPLFLLSCCFFIKKPKPLLIYLISSIGLCFLFFFKYPGALRHHGLIFMVFIFSLWIADVYKDEVLIKSDLLNRLFKQKNLNYLFTGLLLLHVTISPVAFYYDLKYDFSAGKRTAEFLKKNNYLNDDTFIATYWSPFKTPILPYLPKPYSQFYFVGFKEVRSFWIGNTDYFKSQNLTVDEIVDRINAAIKNKKYNSVLLILGKRMIDNEVDRNEAFSERYRLIAYFDKTIVYEESMYIYKLKDSFL